MEGFISWLRDIDPETGVATFGNSMAIGTLIVAMIALLYVLVTSKKVLSFPVGNEKMAKISASISKGANAYLKRQYSVVAVFFIAMFIILGIMAAFGLLSWFVPVAFVTGGFLSGLSGFIGMKIATAANARTANACIEGLNRGLRVAFSAGSVMGFTVVGLGLFHVAAWFVILRIIFGLSTTEISGLMLTFGMGASSMALFARVGGGIFTKAADVGADLVGKVEAGIPEDDPRNPAVIADNVGDNVGDVAGMGADLFESYVGSVISAVALGVSAFNEIPEVPAMRAMLVPLLLSAIGIIASMIGTVFVKTKENASQKSLLSALRKGTNFSAIVIAVVAFPLVWFVLGKDYIGIYGAVIAGLLAGVLIGLCTEYYTSDTYKPTKKLAASSETGSATLIINGLGLGMLSTALPIIIVVVCIIAAYFLSGGQPSDKLGVSMRGLYGIALAAVGMLSTLGITLATDAYGPVADNAGGIAEMAGLDKNVSERTDALDSLGNTTAATGKGFAIGSAALTSLALIASYADQIMSIKPDFSLNISLLNPACLVGLFIGACLPFIFAALTMDSVGKAAQSIVMEVRRQFKSIAGLMEGKADADYATCVDLCTRSSLREMVVPSVIAIVVPIIGGLILGPNGIIGMLAGSTATGFLLAIFMSNSGGAWDNAKKYIEGGHHGGKGSSCHKAAVVGDTVGDPFKDTAGPSINILIKLLTMVSIVFAALIVNYHVL